MRSDRSLALCGALVALAACHDVGAEHLARARLAWDTLVAQGERPDSPAWDRVLAELDAVPADSRHRAEAARLAATVRRLRGGFPRAPLALRPKAGTRPPELEALLATCARLAQLAGADGGLDERTLINLEACRTSAEKLELRLSHGADAPDHPPEGVGR